MLSQKIKDKAKALGFAGCGIIPSSVFSEYTKYLDERINTFPNSRKYYENYECPDYATPPKQGKSIVVATQGYNDYVSPDGLEGLFGKMYLFDNRISYSEENRSNGEFETFLKILGLTIIESTLPARWAAVKAGLGKFGRNNFFYDSVHGSNIIVNTWVVDKVLNYDEPNTDIYLSACNDGCHKCIDACPTKALSGKFSMDAKKCICRVQFDGGYALSDEIRNEMGAWIYGCDDCQDVCPVNKTNVNKTKKFPLNDEFKELIHPEAIMSMNEDTYKNVVNPRFWYAGEGSLWLWKCNALRSMINSGDKKYHSIIKESCNNPDSRISEMAKWGCAKLVI